MHLVCFYLVGGGEASICRLATNREGCTRPPPSKSLWRHQPNNLSQHFSKTLFVIDFWKCLLKMIQYYSFFLKKLIFLSAGFSYLRMSSLLFNNVAPTKRRHWHAPTMTPPLRKHETMGSSNPNPTQPIPTDSNPTAAVLLNRTQPNPHPKKT